MEIGSDRTALRLVDGFDYSYFLPITSPERPTRLDFFMGGGAGFEYITGISPQRPRTAIETDCEPASLLMSDNNFVSLTEPKISRFLPMLDVTLGLQLNFAIAHRLEGGIHDMFFMGSPAVEFLVEAH